MKPLYAYLFAIVGVTGIGCCSIVVLRVWGPESDSVTAGALVGTCTLIVTQLLALAKNQQSQSENTAITAATAATVRNIANAAQVPSVMSPSVQDVIEKSLPKP